MYKWTCTTVQTLVVQWSTVQRKPQTRLGVNLPYTVKLRSPILSHIWIETILMLDRGTQRNQQAHTTLNGSTSPQWRVLNLPVSCDKTKMKAVIKCSIHSSLSKYFLLWCRVSLRGQEEPSLFWWGWGWGWAGICFRQVRSHYVGQAGLGTPAPNLCTSASLVAETRQAPLGPKPSQFCISRVLFTCHKVTQVPIPVRFASDEKLEGWLMLSHHNLAWQNRVVSMKKLNNARTWFNKANIKASKSPLPHLPQKPTAFAFLVVLYLYFWIRCS